MDDTDIRILRNRLALTQEEFAELLSTSQATISQWERGNHQPSASLEQRAQALARAEEEARDVYQQLTRTLYRGRSTVPDENVTPTR